MTPGPKVMVVAVVAGIAVTAAVLLLAGGAAGPDLDAILEDGDCEAAGRLTDADMEKATANQQIGISFLLAACMIGG